MNHSEPGIKSGAILVPTWVIGLLMAMILGAYAFIFTGITGRMQELFDAQETLRKSMNLEAQARIAAAGDLATINFRLGRIEVAVDRIEQRVNPR